LRYSRWVQGQTSKIYRALGHIEGQAGRFPDVPDAGHLAIACALGYLDFRFPDLGWREGRPALSAWYEGMERHPAMQATVPG
jgi:glutathione S-transferase